MQTNIRLWIQACKNLKIKWQILDEIGYFLRVEKQQVYYFMGAVTPFNSEVQARIFEDKGLTYQLLKNKINLPKTVAFTAGYWQEMYHGSQVLNVEQMAALLAKEFRWPVIIKPNKGRGGKNVFLCPDLIAVQEALNTIFNVQSKDYDSVALGQEYIKIKREYRALFFQNQLVLLYEKNKEQAQFVGNLSPLHWQGAKAIQITDARIEEIKQFMEPVMTELPLNYAGADIALDDHGTYWLIELNSRPGFNHFLKNNPEKTLVKMFEIMLESLP